MATSIHLKNNSDNNYPYLELKNQYQGSKSGEIRFLKESVSPEAGDDLGIIKFQGYSNGNTTPTDYCQIIGEAKTTTIGSEEGQIFIKVKSGGSEIDSITINPTGVGIGTDNPQGNMHISSGTSGDCVLILEADTDNSNEADNPRIELKQDMGESIFHIGLNGETSSGLYNSPLQNAAYFLSDNPIQFVTGGTHTTPSDGTARLTIIDNGNVGIGDTNPTFKLAVNGHLGCNGFTIINSSDDRIKYNEENINSASALSIINQLQPQKYEKLQKYPKMPPELGYLLMQIGLMLKIIMFGVWKQD